MTSTPDPRPTLAQNTMGFIIFFVGVAAMVWMKLDGNMPWAGIGLAFSTSGLGAWIVAAPRFAGYVETVERVADVVQHVRGAQLNVAQPPDTSVVVERPTAPDVVVPPQADPVVMRARSAPRPPVAATPVDRADPNASVEGIL